MREIKFRAWHKKAKVMEEVIGWWRYRGRIHRVDTICDTDKGTAIEHNESYQMKDVILMQYTGLKDKSSKGKETYDGDLIRSLPKGYEPREIFEVVWDKERLEWGVKSKLGMITSLWKFNKDFEIIGNIYQNKDLLV